MQHCRGIGWKAIYLLLKKEPDLKNLYLYSPSYFSSTLSISLSHAAFVTHQLTEKPVQPLLKRYEEQGVSFIPIYSSEYPSLLKTLPQPPWGLYAAGNPTLLAAGRKLAVVGARKADEYGRSAIQLLVPELIEHGCVIVSGLAKGVDAFAHEEALSVGGETVAVIAGGFNYLYPKENISLAKNIVQSGLLLSEYPPDMKPEKWQFPARNRIISGLSLGTLVVQAGKKSGSLITAYCALEQGREVFCVPGRMDDPLSAGTNELISDGAKLVRSSEDILSEMIKI
ncbi:DNA-processing protein DprA [Bacillus aerolatus]|uniref:DNA-processing protein DprA n=1 Tax=Bacillus aerolatus TaxID=2653354 RepID=UPI001CDCA68C|nr:DNA-processing protein DprA [Bacillus aerolatus]